MRKFFRRINKIIIFICAKIFALFIYDRKYIKGKWFTSRYASLGAEGWKWILLDVKYRFFTGKNRGVPFPISPHNTISNPSNIIFDVDDLNLFQGYGKYFQMMENSKIIIGKGTWIAPNVGFITANHSINNLDKHDDPKDIVIGENCWIGMNSVILPGVKLANNTIVGAGSIVTKSFLVGNCMIAGNPAKIVKNYLNNFN